VGSYINSKKVEVPLAEVWNGRKWKVQAVGNPGGATGASLSGVSCAAAGTCEAVGSFVNASTVQSSFAEALSGSAWNPQKVPGAKGAKASSLSGVSCASTKACEAGGSIENASDVQVPAAAVWNGTAWVSQRVPVRAGDTASSLAAVSCPVTTSCQAVGGSKTSAGGRSLGILWNGTAWELQPVPSLSGAKLTDLRSVSCTAVRNCEGGGSSTSSPAGEVALGEVEN
jgi:hypothetical protein